MSLIQEHPGLQLPNLTLIRLSPLLRKMRVSLSDNWLNDKLGFSICRIIFKVTKISSRWIPHLLTDEQRVQMAKQLPKKCPKYQEKEGV